jgi:6-phosphofructokinase 2
MSSIITITLNPAIDKSTTIAELVPDKKMKCSNPVFEPGGGGVNVARAIHKLGGTAKAIYLAGGYSGKFFTALLNSEKIEQVVVEIANHTRENLIVLDKKNNQQYRFGMPGPTINEPEWKKLLMEIEKAEDIAYIIASGTVPAGVPADIFARISTIAGKKNAKFIVDTSGEPLQEALNAGVYLVKPNLGELSALVGKEWIDKNQVEMMAKQIIFEKKCEVVIVSMGEAGALLVTEGETATIKPPAVERKSTVGAGDSMVAGIVLSLSKGSSLLKAVQYGVACGTAATMNPGTELCRKEDADKIFAAITSAI